MTQHEPYEIAGYVVPEGKTVVLFAHLVDGGNARRDAGSPQPEASPEGVIRAQAAVHEGVELAPKRSGLFVFVFASVYSAAHCALACHRAIDAYNCDNGCAVRLYMAAHARPALESAPDGASGDRRSDEDSETVIDD